VPNVKPKAGVLVVIAVVVDAEETADDAESEVIGNDESVGIGMVPMVLATSIFTEEVVRVPDADVAAAQSVADTVVVVVDTTVTVTMLSVPMTTVGVAIPFVAEEDVVVEVLALDGILEIEPETMDVGLRVGSEDVVELDEDVKI